MLIKTHSKKVIWTEHASKRLMSRKIPSSCVLHTVYSPDTKKTGKKPNTWEFIKKIEDHTYTIVAAENKTHEWIILSVWVDPPIPGTQDYARNQRYRIYQKSHGWKKVFLYILRILGVYTI